LRNISDTIGRLAAARSRAAHFQPPQNDRLSEITGFGSNPGALRGRIYIPPNLPSDAPLVVVLHGCTQSAAGYDHGSGWSDLAAKEGFAVLFPEQQRSNNPSLCFNWFVPEDTTRDRGEALSIREMIEAVVVKHRVDRKRIFITGLSAGGAMAAAMLAIYPDVFAGGAIIAGLAYGSAATIPEAFDRMRGHGGPSRTELQRRLRQATGHKGAWPRISVWQGSADQTVVPSNADIIVDQWQAVLALDVGLARNETVDGHTRQVWCDAGGHELIEKYTISGMGHGTPIKAAGPDGLGSAAPFMLDVGISSTRRIAQFWRLTDAKASGAGDATRQDGSRTVRQYKRVEDARAVRTDPAAAAQPDVDRSPTSITKVIEDALRAAGLMR